MWSIDRIGMKVICVQDPSVWDNFCCMSQWPLLDQIYTVFGFGEVDGLPGIYLYEISGITCECCNVDNAPWPLECFRALDQRETDISELTKLTKVTSSPEHETV